MNHEKCDFAVVGGDMRQVYAARGLKEKGYRVRGYAFCCGENSASVRTLEEAVTGARAVIAPVPLSADRIYLSQNSGNLPVPLAALLDCLTEGQDFFAGCIPEEFAASAAEKGVNVIDFMKKEEIALHNTIATAEGAVAEAITKSPRNLHGSRCLILGYGRCGKTLTALLRGMNCRTYVCAASSVQVAQAAIFAEGTIGFSQLREALPEYDFIFNTVPDLVLNRELLTCLKPSACIFDLASAPGGTDFEAAEEQGVSAWLLPGLPGRYAPLSAAEEILRFVLSTRK